MNQPNHNPLVIPRGYRWYRPTITQLMYAAALIGSAVALLGVYGLPIGFILLVTAWKYIYSDRTSTWAVVHLIAIALLLSFAWAYQVQSKRIAEYPIADDCQYNLKQITLGLSNYHMQYGSYPPAYTVDAQGRPMHSWRVLILPSMGYSSLYKKFDMSQPWDAPHNLEAANRARPNFYGCHESDSWQFDGTDYFAIVGPQTMWPESDSRSFDEAVDGTENTIMLIEDHSRKVLWSEPTDVSMEEAIALLCDTKRPGVHGIYYSALENTYNTVAFANSEVKLMRQGMSQADLPSLLMINDGKAASAAADDRVSYHRSSLDVDSHIVEIEQAAVEKRGQLFRLLVFMAVALFPLVWIWRSADQ